MMRLLVLLFALSGLALAQVASDERARTQTEAEAGDVDAAFMLGRMYRDGVGGPEDQAEARVWLKKAADAGHAEAETDLGLALLQEGKAVAAVAFFQRAARQDHPEAMHWLYRCYREGLGIERDENLAMMWLHKAAAQGHVIAQAQTSALRDLAVQQLASGAAARQAG